MVRQVGGLFETVFFGPLRLHGHDVGVVEPHRAGPGHVEVLLEAFLHHCKGFVRRLRLALVPENSRELGPRPRGIEVDLVRGHGLVEHGGTGELGVDGGIEARVPVDEELGHPGEDDRLVHVLRGDADRPPVVHGVAGREGGACGSCEENKGENQCCQFFHGVTLLF